MSDTRPQYGELATPEEQRLAAGLPPLGEVQPAVTVAEQAPQVVAAEPVRRRPVDRFVTIGLLAYGLVNVVMTAMSYLDLPASMNQTMKMLGIDGEFTNFAQGRLWGTIATIVLVIGWCVTAALSVRRLRRGKISWWVPVVGATVTLLLTSICIAVPMMGDPAFMAYVTSIGQ